MKRLILVILTLSILSWNAHSQTAPENLVGDWFSQQLRDDALYADVVVHEVTALADEVARLRALSEAQGTTIALLRANDPAPELAALTSENAALHTEVFDLQTANAALEEEASLLTASKASVEAELAALKVSVQAYQDRLTAAYEGATAAGQGVELNPYTVGLKRDWWEFGRWATAKRMRLTRTLQVVNGLATNPTYEIPPGKLSEVWETYQ